MKRISRFIWLFCIATALMGQEMITIAVLELDPRGLSGTEAASLTDRLRSNLVAFKIYEVVDRGNMEAILKEQEFQLSGCTSSEYVVELGQLLGVQKMLSGSVGKVGSGIPIFSRTVEEVVYYPSI